MGITHKGEETICGIVAIFGEPNEGIPGVKTDNFFKQALYADTFRGEDSTGVIGVENTNHSKQVHYLKRAIAGYDFVQYKKLDLILNKPHRVLIGHNRAATRGKVSANTAHPFSYGDVTGVHNGTIYQHNELVKDGQTFEVDSEAIYYAIHTRGEDEVIPEINGAFTLVWWDDKERKVKVIRNTERPLGVIYSGGQTLLTSELDMGIWLAKRNGFIIDKAYSLPVGQLHSFSIEDANNPDVKEMELNEDSWEGYYRNAQGAYVSRKQNNHKPKYKVYTGKKDGKKQKSSRDKALVEAGEAGLKIGQTVEITPVNYKLYKKNGKPEMNGKVEGYMVNNPYYNVEVHNVRFDEPLAKALREFTDPQFNKPLDLRWFSKIQMFNYYTDSEGEDAVRVITQGNTLESKEEPEEKKSLTVVQ